jgi:predicted nucleotidyltransferase
MKLHEFFPLLLEGGKAIKDSSKISQLEVREILEDLLDKIQSTLNLKSSKVAVIGSAGKKPNDADLSGDIDIAVECDEDTVIQSLKDLSDGNLTREMKGIGVWSFGYSFNDKVVQVDLMPVENIKFAEWSFQANVLDLEKGLKGAHRNELFFAIAKYMPIEVIKSDSDGHPLVFKRFFYDLRKGLMEGIRSKKENSKNYSTSEKKVITNDPEKITKMMFGKTFSSKDVSSFDGAYKAILDKNFQYHDQVKNILDLAAKGIKGKGLKVPY